MGNMELKSRLVLLKKKAIRLATDAAPLIKDLQTKLVTARWDKLEDLKTDDIETLASALAEINREYRETLDMMREIEKELS